MFIPCCFASQSSPEELYRRTVKVWEEEKSQFNLNVWKHFSFQLTHQYEQFILAGRDEDVSVTEIVGALEEGILTIERLIYETAADSQRDATEEETKLRDAVLSRMYTEYGRMLLYSSSFQTDKDTTKNESENNTKVPAPASYRCYLLANDPHTLLIGVKERLQEFDIQKKMVLVEKKKEEKEDKIMDLIVTLFGSLCIDNAENAIRNAIALDASYEEAEVLLTLITGNTSKDSVHKRKGKEFVAELFDSFADTFDSKLLETLSYQVPQIIGETLSEIISESATYNIKTILDAGCGTGLAGRVIYNVLTAAAGDDANGVSKNITLVGVDASKKMLDRAKLCTIDEGCGVPTTKTKATNNNDKGGSPLLYQILLEMDLEEMTISNTLLSGESTATSSHDDGIKDGGFDLIVAADVFVYFDSLETVLNVFSKLQQQRSRGGLLMFTCERTTLTEAPIGYRLLTSGRFAHSKEHVVVAAQKSGYLLHTYKPIIPRKEKGIPVDGHLFVFEYDDTDNDNSNANTFSEL